MLAPLVWRCEGWVPVARHRIVKSTVPLNSRQRLLPPGEKQSVCSSLILASTVSIVGIRRHRGAVRSRQDFLVQQSTTSAHADGVGASSEEKPFGSWDSPITAKFITTAGVALGGLCCTRDGTLHWIEGRPQEGGRQVVCRTAIQEELAIASERGGVDVTPQKSNVRTRVHEYGGRAHVFGPQDNGIIYSNFADQRLYWAKADGEVLELTSKVVYEEDARFRFADGVVDMRRNRLICVREDHTNPKPASVVNTICAVSLDGSGKMEVLASGHDFYAAPRLSPGGDRLAYICWDHPDMPWDATQLHVASLDEQSGSVCDSEVICGGQGQRVSVLQPAWSSDGALFFMADMSGWWNLYRYGGDRELASVCRRDAEFAGSAPGWSLGLQNYCFLADGRVVACFEDTDSGASRLLIIGFQAEEPVTLEEFGQECLPRSFGSPCASPDGKTLYLLGGSPDTAAGIYVWSVPESTSTASSAVQPAEMMVSSMSRSMQIDPTLVSHPKLLKFPTGTGEHAFGYYYPPTNPRFRAPPDAKPPLLVKAHGGPTACARVLLSPSIQFWTSRGFAVLDVDYRGSTGYGRTYRERLKGNWGVVDMEDVCAGAQHLVREDLVNSAHLAIDGGSAGGFTTLGALTFTDVFTAGCSLYGVADLAALAGDTHKFESRYLDGLVGSYPADEAIYKARAPIEHTEKLSCPILLLQGAEDKIVPPNQAEMMFEAVKKQGIPCALKVYEGEQHGFRRSENIEDALNSELVFFSRIFGFNAAGDLPCLAIENLDARDASHDLDEAPE